MVSFAHSTRRPRQLGSPPGHPIGIRLVHSLPLLIKTWSAPGSHRFGYIRRSLPSLLDSDLPAGTRIVIVDDRSEDPRLAKLLSALVSRDSRVEIWTNPTRMGPNMGQEYNVPLLAARYPDSRFLVFCDDDVVYHPGWLGRTIQVAAEAQARGLDGVFTALNVPFRKAYDRVALPTSEVLLKERQAALNWVLPRSVYERVGPFKDAGIAYDTEYCNRMAALRIPVICLRPSWVQNIGYFGAYQSGTTFTAPDFVGRLGFGLTLQKFTFTQLARARELASRGKQAVRRLVD
jgi:hypothetical protein